jgi:septal ring factor EnvC (AmiA/AmiB activator)
MYAFVAGVAVTLLIVLAVIAIFSTLTRMYTDAINKFQNQIVETKEELTQTQRDLSAVLDQNKEMNKRISELEAARIAKMNHRTYSAFMEAMAFMDKAIWEDDLETIQEEQDLKKHKAQRQYMEYARAKLLEARDGRKDTRKI